MKIKNLFAIALFAICFSCKEKPLDITSKKVYGFSLASNNFQKYELKKVITDSVMQYNYHHNKNKNGNLFVNYDKKANLIKGKFGTFIKEDYSYNYRGFTFDFYNTRKKGMKSSTILFNKDYGILATQTYGVSFLFLKDSLSVKKNKELFDNISASLK